MLKIRLMLDKSCIYKTYVFELFTVLVLSHFFFRYLHNKELLLVLNFSGKT